MKAPDKIFMPNELLSEEWQRHIEGQDTAYIRKDALLEWVKHRLENLNNVNFNEDNYDAGKSHILSDLINKLNSM